MVSDLIANKKVAYYAGCFHDYYYPEVGMATVKVLKKNGIEVVVPDHVCCGLPMMAKGNDKGAYKNLEHNSRVFGQLVSEGYVVVATCASCGLFIKHDYPLLQANEKTKLVSENIFHITEYLLRLHERGELNTDFSPIHQTVFYHTPCHLKVQEISDSSVRMLKLIPGIDVKYVSKVCCGLSGSYGFDKGNYKRSKDIAGKLYSELNETKADRVVDDCGGCKQQIESGTSFRVDHPIILIAEAYNL
ncbi:MAG: heterodisulfide reductase-related iron-sulfur binding cluster [Dehalococcoidales bacterium]|jgi:glycerol-3-phosphate dehydrogenase subunit C